MKRKGVRDVNHRYNWTRRLLSLALCLLVACVSFAGCSDVTDIVSAAATGEYPVEINGVTISAKPQKVAVLSPSLADVILALGYETQLVAGTQECTQESLQDLTKIPAGDAQAVVDQSPDLVLVDPSSNSIAGELQEAGLTVLEIQPATDRQDFERLYAQVSSALAGDGAGYDAGVDVAQDIFLSLDNINRIVPQDRVTTACYLYDLEDQAVTGDMFGSTIMSYSGVTNIFESLEGGTYDFQSLRVSDPNVIFCTPGLAEEIRSDSRFADFQAVRNDKIVEMDPSYMEWQGRTVVETALDISAAAFPELLEESSMEVTDPTEQIEEEVSSAMESSAAESSALESALAQDTTEYETLDQGDQGDAVLDLQERLTELGYLDVAYDGFYGDQTAQCVEAFQQANGLEATGVADADTQRLMYSSMAKAAGEADASSAQEDSSSQEESSSQAESSSSQEESSSSQAE